MAVAKTELNQTVYKEITQPIYIGSLNLELHPVPRTTIGSTSNQSQITIHTITKS